MAKILVQPTLFGVITPSFEMVAMSVFESSQVILQVSAMAAGAMLSSLLRFMPSVWCSSTE
ncbi:MAG: hypothetical protein J6U24_00675 [Paludibacteraceae bacterium]|nr:hypothetical protein [Paludibacteraceae bacterium]